MSFSQQINGNKPLPNLRENEIFFEAREIKDPKKRTTYLDQTCDGNEELREAVEKLLLNDSKPDTLPNGLMIKTTKVRKLSLVAKSEIISF